ncbi:MAG: TetR/AcrR family transcriptional regulator [Polaromonas sp.]|nr:TetR/AcrR family transcriptional regulator [Polaromonas sp.]
MNERLDRQMWLNAGLARLSTHGPEGLGVTAIAQQLGVTKGSFYWHFKDQGEYLAGLLQEWERTRTQLIIDRVEQLAGTSADKLRRLLMLTVSADPRMMMAVRAWARTDAQASKAIKRVDRKRLTYVTQLIESLGWPRDEAATLARWNYCALIGHFNLEGKALSEAQLDLILGLLSGVGPTSSRTLPDVS